MPELPEVETVRKGLAPVMEGRVIESVRINRPDLRFPFPDRFQTRLTGWCVQQIDRRAKYLLFHLDSGETLLSHLGMSGRYTIDADRRLEPDSRAYATDANPRHDHVVLNMRGGAVIRYNDPRRFGFMDLFDTAHENENKFLEDLGPEPNSNAFSGPALAGALTGRRGPIKTALLDQSVVAGLGNIYVCEALNRARISPRRQAGTVKGVRAERLAVEVRRVIDEAIAAGGSSLSDFAATDGALGYFQHTFKAYGREGQPCRNSGCSGQIVRIVQSGRSTFYCSQCQR